MHTTADDPTKYRAEEEVKAWERKDPLTRFAAYLHKRNLLEEGLDEAIDAEIAAAVQRFEAMPAPDPLTMFDHAYADLPRDVALQRREVAEREHPAAKPDSGQPPAPMRGQRLTRR
jgi:pyruvate dehydrogenase E1 component alpha subunit